MKISSIVLFLPVSDMRQKVKTEIEEKERKKVTLAIIEHQ